MGRPILIGGLTVIAAVAVALLVLGGGDDDFDPSAYSAISNGDSEESVIDRLGEPDKTVTIDELLGGGGEVESETLNDVLADTGLEGAKTLYWAYGGQQYVIAIKDGRVSRRDDPAPCEEVDDVC